LSSRRSPASIDARSSTSIRSGSWSTPTTGSWSSSEIDRRASFGGYEITTPWDALQVGYFISYACWNYLTAPFLFTHPGVETRELEPGQEDGETWLRLHVTFPRPITLDITEIAIDSDEPPSSTDRDSGSRGQSGIGP
jgi:hypothetical protein